MEIEINKHLSDEFYPPVRSAIQKILDRHKDPDRYEGSSLKAISKEFKTLKLCLPRRDGNTTLAKKILADFPRSIYVVPTYQMAGLAEHKFLFNRDKDKPRIFSINQLDMLAGLNHFDIIVVDVLSMISDKKIDHLYGRYGHLAKAFVLLG